MALLDRIGLPNVFAHLDTYHMNIEEGFVGKAIEDCGDRLGYFHIGESHRGYLGTGTVDFTEVFRSLARIGYDGPIAFESFSSAVVDPVLSNMLGVWRNLWSDGYDLARHAKAFMEAQLRGGEARDGSPWVTFLGIDIGTSAVKAVLVDGEQRSSPRPRYRSRSRGRTRSGRSRSRTPGGRRRWKCWPACARRSPTASRATQAIGLSGQMHGAVVLDADDRPLRPAILWNDGRAQAECRLLAERVPEIGRIAGVPPMPGFTAPKLLWLAAHEPELFARIARVLLPKDYVRLRLTGEHATDPVDAAGTLWLDEARRAWSPEILAATGMHEAQLPRVVEGSEPAGSVRAAIAAELGLPPGIPVAAGAGDAAAGAIGIGAIDDGDAFVSLGTSAQYFVTTAAYRPFPEQLLQAYCHGLPAALVPVRGAAEWRQLPGLGSRPAGRARYPGPGCPGRGALDRPLPHPVPALPRRRADPPRRPERARRAVRAGRRH